MIDRPPAPDNFGPPTPEVPPILFTPHTPLTREQPPSDREDSTFQVQLTRSSPRSARFVVRAASGGEEQGDSGGQGGEPPRPSGEDLPEASVPVAARGKGGQAHAAPASEAESTAAEAPEAAQPNTAAGAEEEPAPEDWQEVGDEARLRAGATGVTNKQLFEATGLPERTVRAFLYGGRPVSEAEAGTIARAIGYDDDDAGQLVARYVTSVNARPEADTSPSADETIRTMRQLGLEPGTVNIGDDPTVRAVFDLIKEGPATTPKTIATRLTLTSADTSTALERIAASILDQYPQVGQRITEVRREETEVLPSDPEPTPTSTPTATASSTAPPPPSKAEVLPEVRRAFAAFGIDVDSLPASLRVESDARPPTMLEELLSSGDDPQTILTRLSVHLPDGRSLADYAPEQYLVDAEVDAWLADATLSAENIAELSGLAKRQIHPLRKRMVAELTNSVIESGTGPQEPEVKVENTPPAGPNAAAGAPEPVTIPRRIALLAERMERRNIQPETIFTTRQLMVYRLFINPHIDRRILGQRLRMTDGQLDELEESFATIMFNSVESKRYRRL